MTRRLPDWHHPLRTAAGTAWAAHDEPGIAFVAPAALAAGADGFHLDLVGQDLAVAGAGGHARTVAFWRQRLDTVPDETLRTQLVRDGYRAVLPLPVVSGTLLLRPAAVLGTAPLEVPLDPRGVDGLHVGTRLDAVAADLLLAALRRGAALLTAQALLRVEGVAARHPARLTVDVATLRTGTASLAGEGPGVDEPTLRSTLRDDPGRLGVTVTPPPADDEQALACADAVADRLLARLLVPRLADDGTVRLQVTNAPGVDRLEEDLSATVVVPHPVAPATDPWGPLAHASAADVERAVHRHTAPAFDSGRRTLAVTTVVQPPWAGAAALAVDLVVPAAPPDRPRTLRETVLLKGADLVPVELTLAAGEPLTGTAQVLVVFDGTGAQAVGPPVPLPDDVLVLTADAVPATLLPVRIDPALARLTAHVDVTWTGTAGGTTTQQHVRLTAESRGATLLVPADATDGTLAGTAHHADGRTAATDPQPAGPLALDPFAFPGTGSQEVALSATFAPGDPPLVVELLADSPDDELRDEPLAPGRVVLTPDRPTATWSWFSVSPFQAFRWRLAGTADLLWHPGTAGALDLATALAGSPRMSTHPHTTDDTRPLEVEVDGLVARRHGDHWLVAPTRGDLAHDASGQPALTLVAAGPLTFLSLTAELPQPPGALAALTDEITRLTGEAEPRLVPADLGSGTTELVLDGTTIARGTTSGSGAHTAALAATLTAEQADAVRAALEGARERLVVRFTLTGGRGSASSPPPSSSTSSSSSSTTTSTTTSTTSRGDGPPVTTTDSTTTHVSSGTAGEDAPPPPPPPTDLHLSTDAADWRVPA